MCENKPVMTASNEVSLFDEKKPFASSAVWACTVYSLVPFVGIVFVPFVFVFGVLAMVRGEDALRAMGAGVLILVVQLALWWLLYAVPKWSVII